MAKFCKECGTLLSSTDCFCTGCGIAVNRDTDEINVAPSQQTITPQSINPFQGMMGVPQTPVDSFQSTLDESINPEKELLANYYHGARGTIGYARYSEITLNLGSDNEYYLNTYSGDSNRGTTDSHQVYHSSHETAQHALQQIEQVVQQYDMLNWHNLNAMGMMGAITVAKFLDKDKKLHRVSTDCMPTNGEIGLVAIEGILRAVLQNSERVK